MNVTGVFPGASDSDKQLNCHEEYCLSGSLIDRFILSHCFNSAKYNYILLWHPVQWRIVTWNVFPNYHLQVVLVSCFLQTRRILCLSLSGSMKVSISGDLMQAKTRLYWWHPVRHRVRRWFVKTFLLLCPIQSSSYGCNLCGAFSSCGEVLSGESWLNCPTGLSQTEWHEIEI